MTARLGEPVALTFRLVNIGSETVSACIGANRTVSLNSREVDSFYIHHPGCIHPFTIAPTRSFTWREAVNLRESPAKEMELEVAFELVFADAALWECDRCCEIGGSTRLTIKAD